MSTIYIYLAYLAAAAVVALGFVCWIAFSVWKYYNEPDYLEAEKITKKVSLVVFQVLFLSGVSHILAGLFLLVFLQQAFNFGISLIAASLVSFGGCYALNRWETHTANEARRLSIQFGEIRSDSGENIQWGEERDEREPLIKWGPDIVWGEDRPDGNQP